jgi:hypothetical protein
MHYARTNSLPGCQGRQGSAREPAKSDARQAQLERFQDNAKHGTEGLTVILNNDDTRQCEQRLGYGSRRLPVCANGASDTGSEI